MLPSLFIRDARCENRAQSPLGVFGATDESGSPQQSKGGFYSILRGGEFMIHLSVLGTSEVLFPPISEIKQHHIACGSCGFCCTQRGEGGWVHLLFVD